jgi:hypothetical protein
MSEDIPVVHIRQTRMVTIKLAGATWNWLRQNSSWGDMESDAQVEKDARRAVLAATGVKVGKGWVYTVALPDEQAASVWEILDSIAGAGESMTSQERGDDAYNYRVIRRDADRIMASMKGIGWVEVRRNAYMSDLVPPQ